MMLKEDIEATKEKEEKVRKQPVVENIKKQREYVTIFKSIFKYFNPNSFF